MKKFISESLIKKIMIAVLFISLVICNCITSKVEAVSITETVSNKMTETINLIMGVEEQGEEITENQEDISVITALDGAGTSANPYKVRTAEDLNLVRNSLSSYYILEEDIDLSGYTNWTPIGTSSSSFTGNFNGNNHKISNLKITGSNNYVGLFGFSSGTISNVKLENVNISGNQYVGGLAGWLTGTISGCGVEGGTVSGSSCVGGLVGDTRGNISSSYTTENVIGGNYVGGLVGRIYIYNEYKTITIQKCYTTGNVNATGSYVGGLIGYIYNYNNNTAVTSANATVYLNNCFSTGTTNGASNVSAGVGYVYRGGYCRTTSNGNGSYTSLVKSTNVNINCVYAIGSIQGNSNKGGLVAYCQNNDYNGNAGSLSVNNSYWAKDSTGVATSVGGTGIMLGESILQSVYSGWDFDNMWTKDIGSTPYLRNLPKPDSVDVDVEANGTEENPYRVRTVEDLTSMSRYANYILMNDLDLSEIANWTPIGTNSEPFIGSFNGNGHKISNLKMTSGPAYSGLFGYSTGKISNLKLENINNTGANYVGGLVGWNTGEISNVSIDSGKVVGTGNYVGGIIGYNVGTIINSNSSANINGVNNIGGLIGYDSGSVSLCYATGDVIAQTSSVGGLIGSVQMSEINGTRIIEKCYATGNVKGTTNVGGLIGNVYNTTVDNTTSINSTLILKDLFSTGLVSYTGSGSSAGIGYINRRAYNSYKTCNITISNIYAIGNINSTYTKCGLCGSTSSSGKGTLTMENLYWAKDTTGATAGSSLSGSNITVFGSTINDMTEQSTFNNWDFDSVWTIDSNGKSIPYLRNLPKPESVCMFLEGSGTAQDPFLINTYDDLKLVNTRLSACYRLESDLNLTGVNWKPIGSADFPFSGNFDGNEHTISNLTIDTVEDYVGLFGYSTGTISNLKIINPNIVGENAVGGIAGWAVNISNCSVEGGTVQGQRNIGGLAGYLTGTITSSNATTNVTGTENYVGGLVGYTRGTVTSSYATGNVEGNNYVGGLIGESTQNVNISYATGNVTGKSYIGGLIGRIYVGNVENATYSVDKCYATGNVTAENENVGGIIGYVYNSNANTTSGTSNTTVVLSNLFATGNVEGKKFVSAGIGYVYRRGLNVIKSGSTYYYYYKYSHITIDNIYAIGKVTGEENIGGLVGYLEESSLGTYTITDSYWTPETTKQDYTAGNKNNGIHKNNITYMTKQIAYNTWDFDNTWKIDSNGTSIAYLKDLPKPDSVKVANIQDAIAFSGGEGTEDDPYIVTTAGQLQALNNNSLQVYYKLGGNINLANVEWKPIGDYIGFNGILDGNNKSIINLTIDSEDDNKGLFCNNYGKIKRLNLLNTSVKGRQYVGGIAANNYGEIENIIVENATITGNGDIGGLVGFSGNASKITNCEVFNATITSTETTVETEAPGATTYNGNNAGGIVGNFAGSSITNSNCEVTVNGTANVGGLIGYRNGGTITGCGATGTIVGTGSNVGGLIGQNNAGNIDSIELEDINVTGINYVGGLVGNIVAGTVSNCSTAGEVSGSSYIGGLVGYTTSNITNSNSSVSVSGAGAVGGLIGRTEGSIELCYVTGNVTSTGTGNYIGGLVGSVYLYNNFKNISIQKSYSTGNVTSTGNYVGGLIGQVYNQISEGNSTSRASTINVTNCFATGTVNGKDRVAAGIGDVFKSAAGASGSYNYSSYKTANITISNVYAIGKVTGETNVRGLVAGWSQGGNGTFNITNSYWTPETVKQDTSIDNKAEKNSIAYMRNQAGYSGWDFTDVWKIDANGASIAYLKELPKPNSVLISNIQNVVNYSAGDGTENNPFIITSADQLQSLNNNTLQVYYKLGTDIDLANVEWNPIGNYKYFNGILDGDNKTVSGLTISKNGNDIGLFNINNGTIKNIKLNNINVSGINKVGALAATNYGVIQNTEVENITVSGAENVGGLVGYTEKTNSNETNIITDCEVKNGTVTSEDKIVEAENPTATTYTASNVGGLVGNSITTNIVNSKSGATVNGVTKVGGLIGNRSNGAITNCDATGTVVGTGDYVGGLVGYNTAGVISDVELENVNVTGVNNIGGLVGYVLAGNISNCSTTGEITGDNYAGGLVGYTANAITNSNSSVAVNGKTYVGGLVGGTTGAVTSSNATGDVESTGGSVGGLIGYTTNSVSLCYATGDVNATGNQIGGLIGNVTLSNDFKTISIQKSYATGKVETTGNNVGGLIGQVYNYIYEGNSTTRVSTINVANCFATGTVNGKDRVAAGIGDVVKSAGGASGSYNYSSYKTTNIIISNVYAIGKVTGETNVRGLVANTYNNGNGTLSIANSYWTPETTKQDTSASFVTDGTAKNSIAYMKNQAGYGDWDFENIWKIDTNGASIAYLKELPKPDSVLISNIENVVNYVAGDGTENNPFIITTPEQLQSLNNNTLQVYYKLGIDIDLANVEWNPIGNYKHFNGILDGDNKTISGLTLNKEEDNIGVFVNNNGTIKNLKLNNFTVTGRQYVGGLAAKNDGIIENVTIENETISGNGSVGGLVGYSNSSSSTITDCEVKSGTVNSTAITVDTTNYTGAYVGGLIGHSVNSNITNSKSGASVNGTESVGGLIGYRNNGTITGCEVIGEVTATGNNAGGFIGYHQAGSLDDIEIGNITVTGIDNVGGLIGYLNSGTLNNCSSSCEVNGHDNVGGLVGNAVASISNCNSSATVNGNNSVGGLIGYTTNSVSLCYATGDVNATGNQIGGLIGNVILSNDFKTISIQKSYATGKVETTGNNAGGLFGQVYNYIYENNFTSRVSTINVANCFATGTVKGVDNVAAGIGYVYKCASANNSGYLGYKTANLTISNIYAIGEVTGETNVKGLVANTYNNGNGAFSIAESYWTPETTKQDTSATFTTDGTQKNNISYMKKQIAYQSWNFGEVWTLDRNGTSIAYLKELPRPDSVLIENIEDIINFDSGDGTQADPFVITSVKQLQSLNNNTLEVFYKLGGNINLTGVDWKPIANYKEFNGTLDGNNKIISGLTLNKEENDIGLFKNNHGKIKNLNLNNFNITGVNYIGALVGYNCGQLENIIAENIAVEGSNYVGGLTGSSACSTPDNITSIITNCEVKNGTVTSVEKTIGAQNPTATTYSGERVGGLVGFAGNTNITNSKSNVNVNGIIYVGGLIGYRSNGTITGCDVTGATVEGTGNNVGGFIGYNQAGNLEEIEIENVNVTGTDNVGGLIGYVYGNISNCSASGIVSGNDSVGGLVGHAFQSITSSNSSVTVSGNNNVGGLVGNAVTSIEMCYATGDVEGTGSNIGGLVGYIGLLNAYETLSIEKSYATGTITGNENVGGLIGQINNKITETNTNTRISAINVSNVFATGIVEGTNNVSAGIGLVYKNGYNTYKKPNISITNMYVIGRTTGETNVGGLVGQLNSNANGTYTITNSYWTPETTKQETSAGTTLQTIGEKNTIEYMKLQEAYANWDFENIWEIDTVDESIAYLKGLPRPDTVLVGVIENFKNFDEGTGTKNNPFIIDTAERLNCINNNLRSNYKLGTDIDLTGKTWTPVGNEIVAFTGSLNGNNKTISNLNITSSDDYIGLFGVNSGEVSNLKIENAHIEGNNYVGAVAGKNTGKLNNIIVTGNVEGNDNIGAITGYSIGEISNSEVNATVEGHNNVGGITGYSNAEISCAEVSGTVTGNDSVGGIAGKYYSSEINYSTVTVNVEGTTNVGGIVGLANSGTIKKSEFNGNVVGMENVGGVIGQQQSGTVTETNSEGTVQGNNKVGGITGLSITNATIEKCNSTSTITGTKVNDNSSQKIGGIAGAVNTSTIENCVYEAETANSNTSSILSDEDEINIQGDTEVGGIVGKQISGAINNSHSNATISATEDTVGGIAGTISKDAHINTSYANGKIIGKNNVGGIVGLVLGNSSKEATLVIDQTYSEAEITGEDNVGGLVGNVNIENAGNIFEISNSFSTSKVIGNENVSNGIGNISNVYGRVKVNNIYVTGETQGESNVGGILGNKEQSASVTIKNSYWAADSTKQDDSLGGERRNIDYLSSQEVYKEWDFSDIWAIDETTSTAYLKNVQKPEKVLLDNIENKVQFNGGKGLPSDPYLVSTEMELQNIKYNMVASYKIQNDIDCIECENWEPIGSSKYPFIGSLDGDGKEISNLTIDSETDDIGLFGYNNGTINNIEINNFDIKGNNNIGTLVAINNGTIQDITVNNSSVDGSVNIGGIIGNNKETIRNITIDNSNVVGENSVGGICGTNKSNISGANSSANITGQNSVGGIVGSQNSGVILNVCSSGNVTGNGDNVGGIIGTANNTIISSSYSEGNVQGESDIGGLVGKVNNSIKISKSYATGDVTGVSENIGGIIGLAELENYNATIENVFATSKVNGDKNVSAGIGNVNKGSGTLSVSNMYAIGDITGNENTGGLVGTLVNTSGIEFTNSYWTPDTTGEINSQFGNKRNLTYLSEQDAFTDWDFEDIWEIDAENALPNLRYMKVPDSVKLENIDNKLEYAGGDGTSDSPYIIENLEQLNGVKMNVIASYKLGADIDCTDCNEWIVIGDDREKFTGTFDGDNNTISNLKINSKDSTISNVTSNSEDNNIALFKENNGTIKNLVIDKFDIKGNNNISAITSNNKGNIENVTVINSSIKGNDNVGAVAAVNTSVIENSQVEDSNIIGVNNIGGIVGTNNSTIENVDVTSGTINGTGANIGGIIGNNTSILRNSNSSTAVTGLNNVGGAVGASNGSEITQVSSTGNVTSMGANVGGLVGSLNYDLTVQKSYSTGNVSGRENVGGLVGNASLNNTDKTISIKEDYSTGNVTGSSNVGGLVGNVDVLYTKTVYTGRVPKIEVSDCYAIGSATGVDSVSAGIGKVKKASSNLESNIVLKNIYATGKVMGETNVGGFVGNKEVSGRGECTATDIYWAPETTTQMLSVKGIGERRGYTDLTKQSNYENWDFDDIWSIDEGESLAYLQFTDEPDEVVIANMSGITELYEGEGTEESPYIITSPEQLYAVRYSESKHYVLGDDIDLSQYDNWEPIGGEDYAFNGVLDGDEHTISNLTIESESDYNGLFGYSTGVIENLTLESADIAGEKYTGSVVGYNAGTIDNVTITNNSEIVGTEYVGAVSGYNTGDVENTTVDNVVLEGDNYVGIVTGGSTTEIEEANVGENITINNDNNVTEEDIVGIEETLRKPIAEFTIENITITDISELSVIDTSYDENDFEIVSRNWTIKNQSNEVVFEGEDLTAIEGEYADGRYTISLVVTNDKEVSSDEVSKTFNVKKVNKPVADFEIENDTISKYSAFVITDNSHDIDGYELVEYAWKLLDDNENVVYEGAELPDNYVEIGAGNYTLVLNVKNSNEITSDPCRKEVEVLDDEIAPIISVDKEDYTGDTFINVNITVSDEESGIKWFKYALVGENENAIMWSNEITDSTESVEINTRGKNMYLHIIASDNDDNITEDTIFGPYLVNYLKPVADFTLSTTSVSKYKGAKITDNSHDDNVVDIVKYEWTLTNSDKEVVYNGEDEFTNYLNLELGMYVLSLKVTNDVGLESEVCEKIFELVGDTTPPSIHANLTSKKSKQPIDIKITFDDDESEFAWYKYAIIRNDETFQDWSAEITDDVLEYHINEPDVKFYIQVIASDNDNNISERKIYGPYQISDVSEPVADFEIINDSISKYSRMEITENSYDPTGYDIIERYWKITDEDENIVYEGDEPVLEFTDYEPGIYYMSLVVKNEEGFESSAKVHQFELIGDTVAPTILVTPESGKSIEDIDVTVECSDDDSGFNSFKYAIVLDDNDVDDWSEDIESDSEVITIHPVDDHDTYLCIVAKDNEGNKTQIMKYGPYVTKGKPVASFNFAKSTITKYEELSVTENSYDLENEEITSRFWVVEDEEGNECYSGEELPTKYLSYNVGTYTVKLIVTNALNITSKPCVKQFDLVEESTPPTVLVTPQSKTSYENIDVDIEVTDTESGFKSYKYAFIAENGVVNRWSDEVTKAEDTITITEKEKTTYLHIIAYDNAGNSTEEKVYGPYIIKKPIASFEIADDTVSKYIGIRVKNNSEKLEDYDLKNKWTIKNQNEDVIYEGEMLPIDYSEYDVGTYTLSLIRTNENGVESDECSKEFELFGDTTAPEITTDISTLEADNDIDVNVSIYEKESGIQWYKYAITYDDEAVDTWSEEISKYTDKITLTQRGKNTYIHIIAKDNDNNESIEKVVGPFFINEEVIPVKEFFIRNVDSSDEKMGIANTKFNITNTQTQETVQYTTNINGIIKILIPQDGTENEFIVEQAQEDNGYELAENIKISAQVVEDNINVQLIETNKNTSLKMEDGRSVITIKSTQVKAGKGPYKVKVVKADSFDMELGIKDAELSVEVENEFGIRNISKIDVTKTDGSIKLNKVNGYGNITLSVRETRAPDRYYLDSDVRTINLTRDETSGAFTMVGTDNIPEENINIDNKKQTITIYVPNEMQLENFNFVVNNKEDSDEENKIPNSIFEIVDNNKTIISRLFEMAEDTIEDEELDEDDDEEVYEELEDGQYRTNEFGKAYLNAVKMPSIEGIYEYKVIQKSAPDGYVINEKEYDIGLEFRRVNNVMRIVNVILGEDSEGIVVDTDMTNSQHIQINFVNEIEEPEDLYLSSETYLIDDDYIDRVYPNTTIYDFVRNLTINGNISIKDAKENEVNIEDTNNYIGTAYTVTIEKGNKNITRKVVVVGDINYNGIIEISDVSTIKRTFVKLEVLNEIQSRAADITGNGEFNISDVSQVERFFVKLEQKLFKMINE